PNVHVAAITEKLLDRLAGDQTFIAQLTEVRCSAAPRGVTAGVLLKHVVALPLAEGAGRSAYGGVQHTRLGSAKTKPQSAIRPTAAVVHGTSPGAKRFEHGWFVIAPLAPPSALGGDRRLSDESRFAGCKCLPGSAGGAPRSRSRRCRSLRRGTRAACRCCAPA